MVPVTRRELLGQSEGGPPCPTITDAQSPPRPQPVRLPRRLTQAWSCLPARRRQEVLLVLGQIIAKGLSPVVRKEAGRERR